MKTLLSILLAWSFLAALSTLCLAQQKNNSRSTTNAPPRLQPKSLPSKTNSVTKADFPVIGYLEGRGSIIVIKSGPKGPVYSVKTPEGKVLFENLSMDQLQAQAPEIHQFIQSAVAVNTGHAALRILER